MSYDSFDLLASVGKGSDDALAAWAATGRAGLLVLREVLEGRRDDQSLWPDIHPKDAIDNMSDAVARIAAAHPTAFLDVFSGDRLDRNTFVLTGLGQIDDPRATDRLATASRSSDQWARMHAAIGLGRRASPIATESLTRLLSDKEYLVRYHALRSLERIGDASALSPLSRFVAPTPVEGELASSAIASIAERANRDQPDR